MNLWHEAAAFAARAHRNQVRADGRTPYFSHPARVALTVAVTFGCDDEVVLTAALVHDVLEDTTADYDDLLKRFGPQIAEIVASLSKDKRLIEPEREAAYDRQLAAGPWQVKLIKLADVYDNLRDASGVDTKRRLLERAKRALEVAEDDPKLQKASGIVDSLVSTVQSSLPRD
ncbi:MAG: HD domain-containing protein [Planctomycetota bacterium]|jgi:guanosine-3',5'-bis(diphosphate) 3'-pyrophosphohydrolase